MNVLSLFDGMSCGQIALNRAGIEYDHYYASEIDRYAIQIAKKNYPKTEEIGDINGWGDWFSVGFLSDIDLILAGSPCQGFSLAGKQLNFEDPRSKLFFTFVDILEKVSPKFWMLENVKMKKEHEDRITKILGVEPVEINSALVSAQNRKRLYWANFPITQPEDRGILLKDIIEDGEVDRDKSYTIDANYYKGGNPRSYFEKGRRQLIFEHQSHKRAMVKTGIEERPYRKLTPLECERLQTVPEGYTEGVSNTQRYKMLGNGWTIDTICHILKGI
jgi:DNA (cytosine-5)-methyltransferase 1